jgi:hypothetical protein
MNALLWLLTWRLALAGEKLNEVRLVLIFACAFCRHRKSQLNLCMSVTCCSDGHMNAHMLHLHWCEGCCWFGTAAGLPLLLVCHSMPKPCVWQHTCRPYCKKLLLMHHVSSSCLPAHPASLFGRLRCCRYKLPEQQCDTQWRQHCSRLVPNHSVCLPARRAASVPAGTSCLGSKRVTEWRQPFWSNQSLVYGSIPACITAGASCSCTT